MGLDMGIFRTIAICTGAFQAVREVPGGERLQTACSGCSINREPCYNRLSQIQHRVETLPASIHQAVFDEKVVCPVTAAVRYIDGHAVPHKQAHYNAPRIFKQHPGTMSTLQHFELSRLGSCD